MMSRMPRLEPPKHVGSQGEESDPPFPHLCLHRDPPLPPLRSDVTYARRSCLDESVGNLPSARGCFDRRSLAIDPVCRGTASRCGEGIMRGGDKGGKVAPLSTSPSPKDVDPGEASIPNLFSARPMVRQSLSLLMCSCFLTGSMSCLTPGNV
jgi:hypothetical protein